MTAARAACALVAAVALAGAARGDGADTWRWLAATQADADGVTWAPGLDERERLVAATVLPSTLTLAITAPTRAPVDGDVVGAGFVARPDGLVATSWSLLSRVGRDRWLWARAPKGPWTRAIPLGATWWADVGLARLVTTRRDLKAIPFGDATRETLGRRFLSVGSGSGRPSVVSAGKMSGLSWFDPDADGGRVEASRKKNLKPGKRGTLVALRFDEALCAPGASGAPVIDERGLCVGLVAAVEGGRSAEERVLVRPTSFAKPVLDAIARDAAFDPPDLGITIAWTPDPPPDLAHAREKTKGGALVARVAAEGPANGKVWEGDVVLAVDGRPVFAEVRESFALALLPTPLGVPAEVTLFRGGKPVRVAVTPERSRTLHEDFQRVHDADATAGR